MRYNSVTLAGILLAIFITTQNIHAGLPPFTWLYSDKAAADIGNTITLNWSTADSDSTWIGRHLYYMKPIDPIKLARIPDNNDMNHVSFSLTEGGWKGLSFVGVQGGAEWNAQWTLPFLLDTPGIWRFKLASYDTDDTKGSERWGRSHVVSVAVGGVQTFAPTSVIEFPASNTTVPLGTTLNIAVCSDDADGTMTQQNISIRDPDGNWNYASDWANGYPFQSDVVNNYRSRRSTPFTFDRTGVWVIRCDVADPTHPGYWFSSVNVEVNIVSSDSRPIAIMETPAKEISIALGGELLLAARAIDPDGTMINHNFDIQDPAGQWHFFNGFVSDGFDSRREMPYQFNSIGTYIVRCGIGDPSESDYWVHSSEIKVHVVRPAVLLWYDIGYDTFLRVREKNAQVSDLQTEDPVLSDATGNGAWAPLSPYAPEQVPEADTFRYRSMTPILGPYSFVQRYSDSANTAPSLVGKYYEPNMQVIRQHAYWLNAMGADGFLVDWSNATIAKVYDDSLNSSQKHFHFLDQTLLDVGRAIFRGFDLVERKPKLVFALRVYENGFYNATKQADVLWELYQNHPDLKFCIPDGTAKADKPVLLVLIDWMLSGDQGEQQAAWEQGPQWDDPRFNVRFTNGWLHNANIATRVTNIKSVFNDSAPFWSYIEDDPISLPEGSDFQRPLYRELPTGVAEHSVLWVALNSRGVHSGTLQRAASILSKNVPLVTVLNRFNYPVAWAINGGAEGTSPEHGTCIEPTRIDRYGVGFGFDIFNQATSVVRDLKQIPRLAPTQLQTYYSNGRFYFSAENSPTEFKIGQGEWNFINVIDQSFSDPGTNFTLQVRNAFGETSMEIQR